MVSRTPTRCLKTSFWSGLLHPVCVNLGGNPRGPYVREPSCASRWLLSCEQERSPTSLVSAAAWWDLRLWECRLPHVPREKQPSGDQKQTTPHDAHSRQHAQMLQAQPECGGANGEAAPQDQARDAIDAALQGIWDDSEAITVHEDRTDRVRESDGSVYGSQQQWRRDETIEREEHHEHDQGTAKRETYAYAPLQRRAERRAKQVPDAATCSDQAVEHGRDMLLLHNIQDEKHTGCDGEVEIAGNEEDRAYDHMLPQPGEPLAHFLEQVVTLRPPFILHGRADGEQ